MQIPTHSSAAEEHAELRLSGYIYQCATVAAALLLVLSAIV